ncbi:MAG: hypothetical protein HQ519_05955 [Planctomycetes bacterium]|nr:hypothetical protein [Planctomycetota bacterium]
MTGIRNNSLGMGLMGLLLGAVLGWIATASSEAGTDSAADADYSSMASAIQDLSGEIRELRAAQETQLARPDGVGGQQRQSASDQQDRLELLSRLDQLDQAMAEMVLAMGKYKAANVQYAAAPPLVQPDRPVNAAALQELYLKTEIDNDLYHLNWTYQQVLDEYGKPSRSNPSPGGLGHKWYYELSDGSEIIFWFVNDRVSRAMAIED